MLDEVLHEEIFLPERVHFYIHTYFSCLKGFMKKQPCSSATISESRSKLCSAGLHFVSYLLHCLYKIIKNPMIVYWKYHSMFSYTILNHDLSMKFWNISNPTAGYKSFLFYWALLFKVDILCPPDVWETSCCIEVVTLCLAVGAAAQVDHKRHTWSAVWNSRFFLK